ncbi:DAK2 domain-containing protein [Yinghuangia sp. ASG 101]|uniref:DAK2 domain-containing protein n=1 Tax=Yinghuangia sp. ASG 101 TaxID=2896848 RepID=UPI001E4D326F|nr:DAK2 domain-containing protein [Yinghuangia sp. ASG 101]UGQ14143.1 DAK2 domain-containing protein [Yinghuangia sp. ASG 101]
MLGELDAPAVRRWCRAGLHQLGRAREEIDALNVYPVPDGDTGTNLFLTLEAGTAEVEALFGRDTPAPGADKHPEPGLPATMRALAHGALMGARGNSGVILSQLLRGIADQFEADHREAAAAGTPRDSGPVLRRALHRAADEAYAAVARPVEGTMLTVARAAALGCDAGADDLTTVVRGMASAARDALARTPDQLDVLRRAGVVDAGGRGLCVLLDALVSVVTGERHAEEPRTHLPVPLRVTPDAPCAENPLAPAFEVIYLLDAPDAAIPPLRARLDALGDSLVVVGGEGLWNVHVHVDDAGAAVEAGIEAGRPHRVRITHLAVSGAVPSEAARPPAAAGRAIVAVVHGDGLAALFTEAGARVVEAGPGRAPSTGALVEAIRATGAREVVLLPNDPDGHAVAAVAAEQAHAYGIRVQVVPTKAAVQGIAALAVHEPGRRFDQDVVGMTSAAGGTRYGALTVAAREAWTMAGVCQAGDVLGIIDGDIAVIGQDLAATGKTVLDRMLAGGGELITLVTGAQVAPGIADDLVTAMRAGRPEVDAVVYNGGQSVYPLLIGVE